jgi:hypothetical protein
MKRVANLSDEDRKTLFSQTANKILLVPAIVEIDFWVCYMLDYLFHNCSYAEHFVFKGGTSLSKGYGLIDRFSEDIDLILDWQQLGYGIDEPWQNRSVSKQELFNNEANARAINFIENRLVPAIKGDLSKELKGKFQLSIDTDGETIKFIYPQLFNDYSILQEIRLEIGPLAAWTPTEARNITPYAAEQYAKLFNQPSTSIKTVKPERTFWEKATILHREANRTNGNLPLRYSRHYYDLYKLSCSAVKAQALNNRELLKKVVEFKDKFYHCGFAKYGDCLTGKFKLIPSKVMLEKVSADYSRMQNMIFGEKPTIKEITEKLKQLEEEINTGY